MEYIKTKFKQLYNKYFLLCKKINLENTLNNKYSKVNITYDRTEIDGTYKIDLRNFFMIEDSLIPKVSGKTDDEKALNSLQNVIQNIKYTLDTSNQTYKMKEYWAYPYQTLKHKKGDCEDGAILLANIMIKSGIPYWKVRITVGSVDDKKGNKGGHCFVVYYYENGGYWVLLDWCYWANLKSINERMDYKEESYYKNTWFSFNQKYIFAKDIKNISTNILNKKIKLGGKK